MWYWPMTEAARISFPFPFFFSFFCVFVGGRRSWGRVKCFSVSFGGWGVKVDDCLVLCVLVV